LDTETPVRIPRPGDKILSKTEHFHGVLLV